MLLSSCNSKKKAVMDFLHVSHVIKNSDYDLLLNLIDDGSIAFINEVTDTSNMYFPKMKKIGDRYNLTFFTTIYYHQMEDVMRETNGDKCLFFNYLKVMNLSLYSPYSAPYKIYDETRKSFGDIYIPYGYPVNYINDNTPILEKREVKMVLSDNGKYLFDAIYPLKEYEKLFKEKLIRSHITIPKKINKNGRGSKLDITDDVVRAFVYSFYNQKYTLASLQESASQYETSKDTYKVTCN